MPYIQMPRKRKEETPLELTAHTVKVHPELALACMKAKVELQYRLWLLAREFDVEGWGRVKIADLQAHVRDVKGLNDVRRILKQGETFWDFDNAEQIRLVGLLPLCKKLNVVQLSAPVVTKLPKTLKGFRGVCVFGLCAGAKTISQKCLGGLAGKTTKTVSSYRATVNVRAVRNVIRSTAEGCYTARDGSTWQRLPSTYYAPFYTGPKGMTKKLRLPVDFGPDGRRRRIFYSSSWLANMRAEHLAEGEFIYLKTWDETCFGAIINTRIEKRNGKLYRSN